MYDTIPYVSSRDHTADGRPTEGSAAQGSPGVYLYGLSFCDHCTSGKEMLEELGIPFAMTLLDQLDPAVRRPVLKSLRDRYGKQVVFPVLEIDGEFTFGFNRKIWSELLQSVSHNR